MSVALRLLLVALLAAVAAPARADFITFSFEPGNLVSGDLALDAPATFRPSAGPTGVTLRVADFSGFGFWFVSPGGFGSGLIRQGGAGLSSADVLLSFSAPITRLVIDYAVFSTLSTRGLRVNNAFFPGGFGVLDIPAAGTNFVVDGRDGPPLSADDRPASGVFITSVSAEVAAVPAPPAVLLAGLGVVGLAARRVSRGR